MKRSSKSTKPAKGANHVGFVLLQIDAATLAGEGGAAQFGGIPYSGGVVPNHGWHGDMAIDLASLHPIPGEVAALRDHDTAKIVGRAMLKNDGRAITIERGIFSKVTPDAKEVSDTLAEGHPWKLSVGIKGRFESLGQKRKVELNGRSMEVETILRGGRILEFSFVPSGADPEAYAARLSALAGDQPHSGENEMDELEQAQARVAELTAANATLTTERDTVRTELATATATLAATSTARRNERIVALFGAKALEKDGGLPEAQLTAYRSMTDDQFAAIEATLATSRADPSLFRQQAADGRDPDKTAHLGAEAFVAPAGFHVDQERAQLHAKAVKYQAEHDGVDYLAAVSAVSH